MAKEEKIISIDKVKKELYDKNQEDFEMLEELKTRHKLRFEFWKKLLEKVNKSETQLFKNINLSKDYWLAAGVGITGLGLNFVISRNYGRSELMIARSVKEENKYFFDELFAHPCDSIGKYRLIEKTL